LKQCANAVPNFQMANTRCLKLHLTVCKGEMQSLSYTLHSKNTSLTQLWEFDKYRNFEN
jgi:hypothetical protein